MTLLEKLKHLFTRDEIPDETKAIFDGAKTSADLLKGLDSLLDRNQVELDVLNDEITRVERAALSEEERVRTGELPEREKRNTLLKIKRLRKTMDNYEARQRIYERNINLHLNLMGKVQQMEAMKLGGIDEQKIDQIVLEFEEKLEKYSDVMNAADVHEGKHTNISAKEDRELKALESEILGVKAEPKVVEPALPAAKKKEPVKEPVELPPRRPIDDEIDRALAAEEASQSKKVELE